MKVGIDILEISRIDTSERFIEKICTPLEIEYLNNFQDKSERLCGIFCAKEACFKSLDLDNMIYKDIEIYHSKNGRPNVRLLGKTKELINVKNIDISISHTKTMATAICITEFNE